MFRPSESLQLGPHYPSLDSFPFLCWPNIADTKLGHTSSLVYFHPSNATKRVKGWRALTYLPLCLGHSCLASADGKYVKTTWEGAWEYMFFMKMVIHMELCSFLAPAACNNVTIWRKQILSSCEDKSNSKGILCHPIQDDTLKYIVSSQLKKFEN